MRHATARVENIPSITPKEDKADRFKRIAGPRVERVLESLRVLKNVARPGSYKYTEAEINKAMSAIKEAVTATEHAFRHGSLKTDFEF